VQRLAGTLAPKRQEIKSIENSLAKLVQERTRLEADLTQLDYARNAAHARKVTERHAALITEVEQAGDTLARTIRAVRILTMAEAPDETLIDTSPPPEEKRRNWHLRRVIFYWISRHLGAGGADGISTSRCPTAPACAVKSSTRRSTRSSSSTT
jgi:hypothetical protein